MPHTDIAGACIFAERLRLRVAEQLPITISGGVAAAAENDTQESLVARADAALYSAKTAGRNQIFCHSGEGPEPVVVDKDAVNTGSDQADSREGTLTR
jgi:predicted signal transduction protein with EAL and GGDEF domain